jgi:hypothetical protein
VQVPCHEPPGTSCTAPLEGAGSADLWLSCINHGAIFARYWFTVRSLLASLSLDCRFHVWVRGAVALGQGRSDDSRAFLPHFEQVT